MCRCTPEKRTPFCGAPGCEMPAQKREPKAPHYRSKPVTIEAIRFKGGQSFVDMANAWGEPFTKGVHFVPGINDLVIHTLEGDMKVSMDDYVIRGTIGEFYPCKPEVFDRKYELA